VALGIPKDGALKYQARLQAGEFLVFVTGTAKEVNRAKEVLQNSVKPSRTRLFAHSKLSALGIRRPMSCDGMKRFRPRLLTV
jgi:hypothetical protein